MLVELRDDDGATALCIPNVYTSRVCIPTIDATWNIDRLPETGGSY